jgi:hypothetical protein
MAFRVCPNEEDVLALNTEERFLFNKGNSVASREEVANNQVESHCKLQQIGQ